MGRDLDAVRRVATETDVHVVASGGYYMQRFYPPEIAATNEDQIAETSPRKPPETGSASQFGAGERNRCHEMTTPVATAVAK